MLWPDFSFWDFAKCVLHFQQHHGKLETMRTDHAAEVARELQQADRDAAAGGPAGRGASNPDSDAVAAAAAGRDARVRRFLAAERARRDAYFASLAATEVH